MSHHAGSAKLFIFVVALIPVRVAGKELEDARVLSDVGDVPIQEMRDCGIDDDRLMTAVSESVKLVMGEVCNKNSRFGPVETC